MNMKSLHTQQQIEEALFSLLQKKPYAENSIAEITRKAFFVINKLSLLQSVAACADFSYS